MFADNINAKAGDSISVPVQISKNSGLMGYKVSVSYDKNQLDFIGANIADNWSDGAFVFNDNNGIVDIVWVSSDEISKDGPMFNLLFKIKNNVNSGASKLSLSYDKTSTFNGEYSPVDIVCDGCAIIIEPRITIVSATCSQTEIDYNGKYIYNISVGLNNLTEKIDTVDGYTYALEKKSDKVGTGTKVIVKEGEDIIDCYEVVLFGDVNGDGWYDGMDSIIVNCLAKGTLTVDQVGVAVFMAADCNHDGFVDETDVAILEQAGLLLSKVDQSTNTDSLIETDSAYVEYVNIIDQSIEKENDEDEEKIINDETVEKSRNMLAILFDFAKRFLNQIISFFRH